MHNKPGHDGPVGTPLGSYLRERRARLDPAALGLPTTRRRTPGLRREEVAQRACVSATWYTWLEQGRGGAPSTEALERIAAALLLNEVEREHLFLLAQQRPPRAPQPGPVRITAGLRGVLDALPASPAFIKNAAWDVLAWNRAAAVVLTDYARLPPARRNILHLVFARTGAAQTMPNWEQVAGFVVATFRAETARVGEPIAARAAELVDELSAASPVFRALWEAGDVRRHGAGTKHIHKPGAGAIGLDYSAFAIEGQPGLSLVVYTAATAADGARIDALLRAADRTTAAA
jgi:transcriptional regulator with XRE-family HTH domain